MTFLETTFSCIIFASTVLVFFACRSFNEGMENGGGHHENK
jgi:hypothetical protein